MKKALLAAVLLLHAATAGAADIAVSSDANMTTANATAVAGDRVLIAPGTYTVGIAPANSGTAGSRITYMGAANDSSSVVVPSITLNNDDYITVKWLRCSGNANIGYTSSSAPPGASVMGAYDSLYFCSVLGGMDLTGSDHATVANCRIGKKFGTTGIDFGAANGRYCSYLTMNDCKTFTATDADGAFRADGMQNSVFNRVTNHSYLYGSSAGIMSFVLFRSPNNTFTDCRWDTRSDNATVNLYQFNARDTSRFNVFLRDTFYVDTTGTGERITWDPGTSGCCAKTDYNEFRYTVIHCNGYFRMQVASNALVFDHCQLVLGRMTNGFNNSAYLNDPDSLTFTHNTLVLQDQSSSSNNYLWDNGTSDLFTGRTVFKNNIIVLRRHTSTEAMVVMNPSTGGGGSVDWNYNLYYSYAAPVDSTRFLNFSNSARGFPMSTSSWCNTVGNDCNSRFGDPGFADISAYDYTPSGSGNAVGGWWPDGYVGAIDPAGTDVTAPEAVSDLGIDENSYFSETLVWTAPGDDGATGTATSYDIRYSTSAIDEGNWESATQATGEPTPQVAGSSEGPFTVTGLTPGVTYHFAMKSADEAGNISALSNVPSGATGTDSNAPTAVADLAVNAQTTTTMTLNWEAPEDTEWGTVTSYDMRRSTSTITEGNWASATQLTGEPTPQANPNEETYIATGLTPATTYYFAVKSTDGSGNISAISNVANGTTDSGADVVRPDTPIITAKYYAPGTAIVTFTAVGDDSLDGTATSYDLRYGLGTQWFNSSALWPAAGLQARTYRYDLEGTPKASGSADTIYVWGLQPGRTYDFMLRVSDDAGNESGYSNRDTVAIPSQAALDVEPYPRVGIYGGAGPVPNAATYPLLNQAQTDIQTAYTDSVARYPVVSLAPGFTDDSVGTAPRTLAFAAIRRLRTVNPTIKVLGEPLGNVAYVGNRWNADTVKAFSYYAKVAKALDHATGDSLKYIMSTTSGGQIVTNGSDATTSFLIRKATAPYKHIMWDAERSSSFGGQGSTLSNVDITDPRVRDSLVAVITRHYLSRVDPVTGAYAYDGVMLDLHQPDFYSVVTSEGDTPDYARLRGGFASRAAFDSAWVQSHHLYMRSLRKAAIQAGRPDFIISGNSRSGVAFQSMNGWMREGWPAQQGGTWHTNLKWVPGGQVNDAEAFGWKPQMSWVFLAAPTGAGTDSLATSSSIYTESSYKDYRYGLGTAALTGARFMYGPSDAALARAGVLPRWYGAWWFDETGAENGTSSAGKAGVGWLGQPLGRYKQTSPLHGTGTGRSPLQDSQGGIGDFDDAGDMGSWSLGNVSGQSNAARVTDTTYAGAGALRIRVGTRQTVDYLVGATGSKYGTYLSGDTVSIEFWAKASEYLPFAVGLRDSATGSNRLSVSSGTKVWVDTDWTHHRIVGTVNANFAGAPYFWAGDTTGTFWVDEVKCIRGKPRGGLYYREFDNGVVVVNPYASVDTFVTTRGMARLTGLSGRPANANDGTSYASGASVPVPPGDALFLVNDDDTTPPATVADMDTMFCSASTVTLRWTAPGDDASVGTATSYDLRYSSSFATLLAWSGATQATEHAPSSAGDTDSLTIKNLSPNTIYYVAIRTSDEVPNESAQSATLTVQTRASGADIIRPATPSLSVAGRGLTNITLRWAAVGDDSLSGSAAGYDLRYSTSAINAGNFSSATQFLDEPTPGTVSDIETVNVSGLTKGTTYYFGLIVEDESGNPSALATTSGATKAASAVRFLWWNPWTWIRSLFP